MASLRIKEHPILTVDQHVPEIQFEFNGKIYTAREGDTIASALLLNGIRTLRVHEETASPRGIYCNIGHCFECRVTVNETAEKRACLTPLEDGMVIHSGQRLPTPFKKGEE
ncbi:(2Fe-2S)-binding protein [Aquibacillus sp. 3ASR75-11]|uniref:(2Fe-2S)-binding protein n=1 Tax=Terrihalobacillus insolitus TaxID=2950438 RepID=A0A9X3WTB9_9BACI|nr:(2Fe-2S)-binding protein [Terrihalobacillus insolitus]MDC3425447.1 (2Fe-2S)-binding protein [Terrihalobacillus insolitus]